MTMRRTISSLALSIVLLALSAPTARAASPTIIAAEKWMTVMEQLPGISQEGFSGAASTIAVKNSTSLLADAGVWKDVLETIGFTLGEFTLYVQSATAGAKVGCPVFSLEEPVFSNSGPFIPNPWDCASAETSFVLTPGIGRRFNVEATDQSVGGQVSLFAGPTSQTITVDYVVLVVLTALDFLDILEPLQTCSKGTAYAMLAAIGTRIGAGAGTLAAYIAEGNAAAALDAAMNMLLDVLVALAEYIPTTLKECGGGAVIEKVISNFATDWIKKIAILAPIGIAVINVTTLYLNTRENIGMRVEAKIALQGVDAIADQSGAQSPESSTSIGSATDCSIRGAGVDLHGCDLQYRNFKGVKLSQANLAGAWFYGATLDGADLSGVDCRGTKFLSAALVGADLSGADCRGAVFELANLSGVNFRGADLSGANLDAALIEDADFSGANLSGAGIAPRGALRANFTGANVDSAYVCCVSGATLSGVNLRDAKLAGADLNNVDLRGVDLHGTDLSYANLNGADLSGADLSNANLAHAELRYAKLVGANLSGATLTEVVVWHADFSGAILDGANLSTAKGNQGSRFSKASLRGAILRDASFSGTNFSLADLTGADLTEANLTWAKCSNANFTNANLTYVDFSNADLTGANLSGALLNGATKPDGSAYP